MLKIGQKLITHIRKSLKNNFPEYSVAAQTTHPHKPVHLHSSSCFKQNCTTSNTWYVKLENLETFELLLNLW